LESKFADALDFSKFVNGGGRDRVRTSKRGHWCRSGRAQLLWGGGSSMLYGGVRLQLAEKAISQDLSPSASAMAGLFAPLDRLLCGGGGPRPAIQYASGRDRI